MGPIIGAVIIGLWLLVAIIKGLANGWNGYADKDTYSTSTYYKPDSKPATKPSNNSSSSDDNFVISGQITVERMGEYTDDTDLDADEYTDDIDLSTGEDREKSLLEIEEEERLLEPYVCPECGEPYDGILCDVCGHRNDEIGYEEESEADQWFENMAMMAFFDAEDKKMEAEREERENFLFGDYSDEFDEDDEW